MSMSVPDILLTNDCRHLALGNDVQLQNGCRFLFFFFVLLVKHTPSRYLVGLFATVVKKVGRKKCLRLKQRYLRIIKDEIRIGIAIAMSVRALLLVLLFVWALSVDVKDRSLSCHQLIAALQIYKEAPDNWHLVHKTKTVRDANLAAVNTNLCKRATIIAALSDQRYAQRRTQKRLMCVCRVCVDCLQCWLLISKQRHTWLCTYFCIGRRMWQLGTIIPKHPVLSSPAAAPTSPSYVPLDGAISPVRKWR